MPPHRCASNVTGAQPETARAAIALGGHAWEKAGRIWYETLRDKRLKPTATFLQFARYTVANAEHGFGAAERKAVAAAWEAVGIKTGN